MCLEIFYFKQCGEYLRGLLFFLDLICQGPLIIKIVICIHCLIGSSPYACCFVFCLSVNMYVFNVKSYKKCHKTKKGIKKAVTGLVIVIVCLITCKRT